ncbi:hypothetical protein NA56DRAFT_643551 [Hyaloscypha hepaticicola]|uniref:ABM domain-containing protein n=1 Tax=Hyaloscypha hepaticicola TaxID=2082293 RepID=A0A2J6QDJ9_9HELO|nr:hypothetical protein NA56DRAFT_643551 [Hyaloscypha hepaticicola]
MVSEPLTLHITWHFAPEDVATFYEVLRPLHENLVKEKECLYFNVYEIAQQPGIVRLVEIWDCDMKWMAEVQSKKDYYAPFFETTRKIALEPQKIEVMKGVGEFRFMRS